MGITRIRTNISLGSINTSKLFSVSSSEILYTLGSGNIAFEATNLGSFNIFYGNSDLTTNFGGLISPNGSKFWDSVTGNFTLFFRLNSGGVTSNLVIQEYAGN